MLDAHQHVPRAQQLETQPEVVHETLRQRAAEEGMSLQAYVTRLLERETELPSRAEIIARLDALPKHPNVSGAEAVRLAREELP